MNNINNTSLATFRGKSMLPTLCPGDRLFLMKFSEYNIEIGDIVLVYDNNEMVAHRIIMNQEIILLKGDRSPCLQKIVPDDVHALVVGINRLGKNYFWGKEGQPFKRIIATLSRYTSHNSPRLIKKLLTFSIIFWGTLSFRRKPGVAAP